MGLFKKLALGFTLIFIFFPNLLHSSKKLHMKTYPNKFTTPLSISKKQFLDEGSKTDKQFRQLIYDLYVVGSKLEVARGCLAKRLGVSSPQYNILMVIAQHQGDKGITISGVARHLHVSLSHVTTEARNLEKLKWVISAINESDRRVRILKINPSAIEKITVLSTSQRLINDNLFMNLSKSEFDNLSKIISSLVDDFTATISKLKL